jgi:DNA-binding MarR family transcriptional regulator
MGWRMIENPLAADTFHKVLKILRFLRQHSYKMQSEGISPRDYAVLRFLLESGPATVGEVQTYLHKSPSTTSTLIAQLEEAGYVSRTRSQQDNRVVVVELTPAGQEVAEETPLGGLPLLRHQLRGLPEDRLGHLNQALTEIMQLMEVPEDDEFS